MKLPYILFLPAVILTAGCAQENFTLPQRGGEVHFVLEDEDYINTRSSIEAAEDGISHIQIWVTDENGIVAGNIFSSSTSSLSFTGQAGHKYRFFALANDGSGTEIDFQTEDEIIRYSRKTTFDEIARYGIPMSFCTEPLMLGSGETTVRLNMKRLFAKLEFALDMSSMEHADSLIVTSVRTGNGNSVISPFTDKMVLSSPDDAMEYDYASPSDLADLRNGKTIRLYIPENDQGVLLPENTDPWSKVPSSIDGKAALCTFLEVRCEYGAQGLSTDDLCYRMYLGNDNVTDFSIKRNTRYQLLLSPTEDEMKGDRENWKIEPGTWTDTRTISFSPSPVTVPHLGTAAVTIGCLPEAFDFTIVTEGLEDAGCTVTRNGNIITIKNVQDIPADADFTLKTVSWDRALSVECPVTVKGMPHTIMLTPSATTVIPYGESRTFQVITSPPALAWNASFSLEGYCQLSTGSNIVTVTNVSQRALPESGFLKAALDEDAGINASVGIVLGGNPNIPYLDVIPRQEKMAYGQRVLFRVKLVNCDTYTIIPQDISSHFSIEKGETINTQNEYWTYFTNTNETGMTLEEIVRFEVELGGRTDYVNVRLTLLSK